MKIGDTVRVTSGEFEGNTGEVIGEYEPIGSSPADPPSGKWWVQFAHMDSEAIEEGLLEVI